MTAKENTHGAAVQLMLPQHRRADLIQTQLFSVEGHATCYACRKVGFFVVTIVVSHFYQCFTSFGDILTYNLTLYNTLTKWIS